MNLVQVQRKGNAVAAIVDDEAIRVMADNASVRELALRAYEGGGSLASAALEVAGESISYDAALREGDLLSPVTHPDPAHLLVTGTGLTHLGSADTRDSMHKSAASEDGQSITDSMRMFQWGLDGGKPVRGAIGVQPEWFYKGDGSVVTAPGKPLYAPAFGEDFGEEPELAGIYVIAPDGTPLQLGFAIGNESSDHVMERQNYLYLAHSKLRSCSFGPELRLGLPQEDIHGVSRITRGGAAIWEKPFLTGEANMSHSLANLQAHHFKYAQFRRPGDVHVHFMGTATLSFADGIQAREGDVFEIFAEGFGRPLRNPLRHSPSVAVEVKNC